MAKEKKTFDLKEYPFPTEEIPRLNIDNPETEKRIAAGLPVVITDSGLVRSALHWDLDYLQGNIGDGKFTVYKSKNKKFQYFDDKKVDTFKDFEKPMEHMDLTFPEFVKKLKTAKPGKDKVYLQQALNEGVGKRIVADFLGFNWSWVTEQQKKNKFGALTSNLLLIGMEGNVTPAHYDEQENFFAQIRGYKRFILFHPDQFKCMYPYPTYHPCDRQSQVDFDNPDYKRFPKFKDVKGYETVVGPSDVLFLPMYWWHQVESLPDHGHTISVTFWYKAGPIGNVVYPLSPQQKVSMMRNLEKMIHQALNNTDEIPEFMQNMVLGRYTDPPA